ncbi:hypothetical protein DFJ73DRAFT_631444 [Zopfochytrium polystomum]|nr:hypothetical protein DFJ73DRAFT_631444 [Zopfochytrium polystomum]
MLAGKIPTPPPSARSAGPLRITTVQASSAGVLRSPHPHPHPAQRPPGPSVPPLFHIRRSDTSLPRLSAPPVAQPPSSAVTPFDGGSSQILPPHARSSKPSKQFACLHPGCTRVFTRRQNMDCHMTTHTGVRPHSCSTAGCPAKFRRRQDLYRHERSVHKNRVSIYCGACACPRKKKKLSYLSRRAPAIFSRT